MHHRTLRLVAVLGTIMIVQAMATLGSLAFLFHGQMPDLEIVVSLRVPRLMTAWSVGAIVAVCGAVMQAQFRNPLADAGLIGVSGGASLGAVTAIALGASSSLISLSAFAGALLASSSAQYWTRGQPALYLILAGVALNALSAAVVSLILSLVSNSALRSMTFWLLGNFSLALPHEAALLSVAALIAPWGFYRHARALDNLLLGETATRHAGINPLTIRRILTIWVALLMGLCVAVSGMVGFIGLVVPHMLRQLGWGSARQLLPLSALGGAVFAASADYAAQRLIPPYDLPVGALTSVIGAGFLLWILKNTHAEMHA